MRCPSEALKSALFRRILLIVDHLMEPSLAPRRVDASWSLAVGLAIGLGWPVACGGHRPSFLLQSCCARRHASASSRAMTRLFGPSRVDLGPVPAAHQR